MNHDRAEGSLGTNNDLGATLMMEALPLHLPSQKRFLGSFLLLASVLILTGSISAHEGQTTTRYPQFVIFYSYRSSPENRPALRKYMETDAVVQFEKWKSEGVFKDYMI